MPLPRPWLPDQELFNIGEACRIAQVPDYTLRYWESRLKLLRPARRTSGHRRYTKRDLEIILRLKDLIHNRHLTLAGARRILQREISGRPTDSSAAQAEGQENRGDLPAASAKILREIRSELRDLLSDLS